MSAKTLKFEYCECGCHCYVANAGPLSFEIFYMLTENNDPYGKKPFRLNCSTWGKYKYEYFTSYDEAKAVAQKIVDNLKESL